MKHTDSIVATYNDHSEAEAAVRDLQKSGFNMQQLSIVGKGYQSEEHAVGYSNIGDRMVYWGREGAFWGGLWGFMFGAAFCAIPALGPILATGPLISWIVGAVEGALVVGSLSALGAGLYGAGIPRDSIVQRETAIKASKFLVIAHGTSEEVRHAADILHSTSFADLHEHAAAEAVFTSSPIPV